MEQMEVPTIVRQDELLRSYYECVQEDSRNSSSTQLTLEFEQKGLKFRHGRWTELEKRKLHENFEKFVKEYEDSIGDPLDFVDPSNDAARRAEVLEMKAGLGFYIALSEGLYRTCASLKGHIYLLHPTTVANRERYTKDDIKMLKSFYTSSSFTGRGRHRKIAEEMGRSWVSIYATYRNFVEGKGKHRRLPTEKQQRRLIKILEKLNPDKDLTCELVHNAPWKAIAEKIGYADGKYLAQFYVTSIKVRDDDGRVTLTPYKKASPPSKLVRKFVKHVSRQKPTHLDALDWDYYYAMLHEHCGGVDTMKLYLRNLLTRYKIDIRSQELYQCTSQLYRKLKAEKNNRFTSIWKVVDKKQAMSKRWNKFHWVLSPELTRFARKYNVANLPFHFDECNAMTDSTDPDVEEVW